MSSNTDDLGNPKVDLPDGAALYALPYEPDLAAKSIENDISQKTDSDPQDQTPDPTAEGEYIDPTEDGGPLRRFTDVKSPLGMVGLESLAKDEDEVAKAISARSDEIYRTEFPIVVPKYEAKCEVCGAEYDDADIEACRTPGCDSEAFTHPDFSERPEIRRFMDSVNTEGQSMRQLGKITDEDHSRLGVMGWVLRWTYLTGPRDVADSISDTQQVLDVTFDELVRGDPKRIVPVVDENGRVGGLWWTCPIHREEAIVNHQQYHEEGAQQCLECGCDLREVHYVELEGAGGNDPEKYFFEHEIVMYAGHVPQSHGLDGLSPVHLVWLEQSILHWMDVYAAEYFNPHSERTPNKFLIVHTANPDSFERQLDEAKDEAQQNPYKSGIFYNQLNPEQSASTEAQVIDVMGDEFLGQSEDLRKRFENHIRTVFGVTDVFDSELEDAGGLNNEGLQLEVTDRSIAAAQQDYSDGPYDELLRYLGYEDWRVKFVPPREQDLGEQRQAVQLLREAAEIGLPARMENGEPVIGDGEAEAPATGMDEPGAGPTEEGESELGLGDPEEDESGNRSADDTDEALRELTEAQKHLTWAPAPDTDGSVGQKFDPMANGHQMDPEEGIVECENTGGSFEAESMGELDQECPYCEKPISVFAESGSKATIGQKGREPFWDDDGDVPEFVKEAVREALRGKAIQTVSSNLPATVTRTDVQDFFEEQLSQPQGWSLRSLAENYAERFDVPVQKAFENVRTQSTSILNKARADGYREQGDADDREFKWIGPDDADNTDACLWLKEQTNPDHGGEPVPLGELESLVQQANDEFFPEFDGSDHNPHWSCRHTFVEHFG